MVFAHGYNVVGGCSFIICFMSFCGFCLLGFRWTLNILRCVFSLSFDIPLCFDNHSLSSDALFS